MIKLITIDRELSMPAANNGSYPISVSEVFEQHHPNQVLCRLIVSFSEIPYWA
jgi:hypothetical protein